MADRYLTPTRVAEYPCGTIVAMSATGHLAGRPTGPRRSHAGHVLQASTIWHSPVQLTEPLSPGSILDENRAVAAAAGRHQSKVVTTALTVSAALHSINLFARNVVVSDPQVLARGRIKTWIFGMCFVIISSILFGLNVAQQQVFRVTLNRPPFHTYQSIAQFYPQCPCGNPDSVIGSFVHLNTTTATNFTTNMCSPLVKLIEVCSFASDNPQCTRTDVGALFWTNYLSSMSTVCYSYSSQFDECLKNIYLAPVGALLLDPIALQTFAARTALAALQTFGNTVGTVLLPIITVSTMQSMPVYELSFGSTVRSPPNCTCRGDEYFNPSPKRQANGGCTFHAVFDSRDNNETAWSCNNAQDILTFPLELLTRNATYEALSIPPPYDPYTSFVGAESIGNATLQSYLIDAFSTFFVKDAYGVVTDSQLQPGFVTTDFSAHYASCAPETCTYVYADKPTLLGAVTTLLGLISGVQTVLMLLVDRGYDLVFKPKVLQEDMPAIPDGMQSQALASSAASSPSAPSVGSTWGTVEQRGFVNPLNAANTLQQQPTL